MPFNPLDTTKDARRELVADYLDHLCGPLLGNVPLREREAIRAEVEDHLCEMIDGYESEGLSVEEATRAALRSYGEPWQLGRSFLDNWQRYDAGKTKTTFSRSLPGFCLPTFVALGLASAFCHLETQANLLSPKPNATGELVVIAVAFVAPILAGICAGRYTPVRPGRAVLFALIPVLLHSAATSFAMLPARAGYQVLVIQLLYWLPVAAASAAITASVRQHRRCSTYLRRISS